MADLAAVGIDFDDVVKVLEDEGVDKFAVSWNELLESLAKSLKAAAAGAATRATQPDAAPGPA